MITTRSAPVQGHSRGAPKRYGPVGQATRLATAVLGALLVYGCVTAPVQEMSDARQALDAAETAAVASEPPLELIEGRELLQRAEESLERGDYEQARVLAIDAREAAVAAREKSLAAR